MRKISFLAVLLIAVPLWGQRKLPVTSPTKAPANLELPRGLSSTLPRPAMHALAPLSAAEHTVLTTRGRLPRIGVHRNTNGVSLSQGRWDMLADGTTIWRLAIRSQGAAGVRLQFGGFDAGVGKVWVYSDHADATTRTPYTARGIFGTGEFWSQTIWSDTVIVEYQPQDPASRVLPFEIRSLAHRVTARGTAKAETPVATDPAAACNLDAVCYSDWSNTLKSVSMIIFETEEQGVPFEAVCTASLLATRDNNLKPYLLTAGHCINNEKDARSLEAFWTYQTSSCQGAIPYLKDSTTSSIGANYLASGTPDQGDYSLLLLKDVPDGVLYSGWDVADAPIGSKLVGIHHPAGGYKRILFGHRNADHAVLLNGNNLAPSKYYVLTLDNGIAEPGSSGSPLFSAPGVIVGTLTWGPDGDGPALCSVGSFDIGYGRFSVAYPNLVNWLEDLPYSEVVPAQHDVTFLGSNGTVPAGLTQTVPLSTQASDAVPFSVRADADWLTVSIPTDSISAGDAVPLTITINPKTFTSTGVFSSTVTILSGGAAPVYINVCLKMQYDLSDVVIAASPTPVAQGSDGLWAYNLSLRETAGVDTHITLLRIDGTEYTSQVPQWLGSAALSASGSLQALLKVRVLNAPTTQTIEVGGLDDQSKKSWYRVLTVPLTPGN